MNKTGFGFLRLPEADTHSPGSSPCITNTSAIPKMAGRCPHS